MEKLKQYSLYFLKLLIKFDRKNRYLGCIRGSFEFTEECFGWKMSEKKIFDEQSYDKTIAKFCVSEGSI